MYNKIVTHPGKAHRDEFLACGLAFAQGCMRVGAVVERRDPTLDELRDPEVLVLDVGMQHCPAKSNFDHHQINGEECSLTLFAKEFEDEKEGTTHDALSTERWYKYTALMDTRGGDAVAKELELPRFPYELASPIEGTLLQMFEQEPTELAKLAGKIVGRLLDQAKAKKVAFDWFERTAKFGNLTEGVQYLWLANNDAGPGVVSEWARRKKLLVAVSIIPDGRGSGWSLFRFDEFKEKLDLSRLEGRKEISFAHKSGHLAKTRHKETIQDVVRILQSCIVL